MIHRFLLKNHISFSEIHSQNYNCKATSLRIQGIKKERPRSVIQKA